MARGDLNGRKINHWTIIDDLGGGKVICQCDCENKTIKELYKKAVVNGKTKSCGCIRRNAAIKVGDYFNDWEVLEKRPNRMALCRCSCGTIREVFEGTLKNGASKSCGHSKNTKIIKKENKSRMSFEIEGKQFGDWKVLKKLDKDKALCECTACGKQSTVYISNLKNNRSKSCGCQNSKYKQITIDKNFEERYIHKRFNYLEIIGRGSKPGYVTCKCECNNIKEFNLQGIINGTTKSCGCKRMELYNKTMIERYGDTAPNKLDNPREAWQIDAVSSDLKLKEYIINLKYKPSIYELCGLLGVQEAQMGCIIHKYKLESLINWNRNQSIYEKEIASFISEIYTEDVVEHCRDIIYPNEIDIYLPSIQLGIEFNGDFWHSTQKVNAEYHISKTARCKEHGIKLIHIFEYEWVNNKIKIKQYIKNIIGNRKIKIYAKDLKVEEVNSTDAYIFEDKYHLQGRSASSINIALKLDNAILGLMTFGKPRFNSNVQYELIRLCYVSDTNIIGGAEKMFKYFLDTYNPKNIVSYCNVAKFTGEVYSRLGFKLDTITKPNYVWVNNKYNVLTRYQTQKRTLVEKGLGDENDTEDTIMIRQGYLKIYDCGNLKYLYEKE